MTLIAIGINHNTAPVALRERVAFTPDALLRALASLKQIDCISESVIVSTCNRTEVYVATEEYSAEQVLNWLAEFHQLPSSQVNENSYIYKNSEVIEHLIKVACGLDSLILGEPQILGQTKQAFNNAKHAGMVGALFEKLFQHTFSVAKKVRSETQIGENAVSVAYAAVQLAKHIFASLTEQSVLLVGAGETIELVGQHLKEQNIKCLAVANRTLSRASKLAQVLGGESITLAQLPEQLHKFDIVISSTASQLPLIGKGMIENALKLRKNLPMFLVDLAVPRDIEGQVNELGDAYLYTVDDLQNIVEQNLASREQASREAQQIITEQVTKFLLWQQSQKSIDLVKQYRQQGIAQRDELVSRAVNQLNEGKCAEEVVTELANKLTNSLLHPPTLALKSAAVSKDKSHANWLAKTMNIIDDVDSTS